MDTDLAEAVEGQAGESDQDAPTDWLRQQPSGAVSAGAAGGPSSGTRASKRKAVPPAAGALEQRRVEVQADRFLLDLESRIAEISDRVTKGVQAACAQSMADIVRAELTHALAPIKQQLTSLESKQASMERKQVALEKEVAELKAQVQGRGAQASSSTSAISGEAQERLAALEHAVQDGDRRSRCCNVVMHGLAEGDRLSPAQGVAAICAKVGVAPPRLMQVTRMGRPRQVGQAASGPGAVAKPRPVHIVLQSEEDKHAFFKLAKRKLRLENVKLDEDLTVQQRQQSPASSLG